MKAESKPKKIGRIQSRIDGASEPIFEVDWFDGAGNTRHTVSELETGVLPGFYVQDVPSGIARQTLGPGTVQNTRKTGGTDMALVQLESDGRPVWLPAFSLVRIMDPKMKFMRSAQDFENSGERLALNLMAAALKSWNEATGALDRLDVDPLPHQIQLVHHILSSGQTNWIIADDVGLGKTIEVGLLLGALERRGHARRVLVITPASLTKQWQDEMRLKFGRIYEIYGRDFNVDEAWKWKLHDRVIASLDQLKPRDREDDGSSETSHFGKLMMAEKWDLVIFDEGHRLSRTDKGSQTLRYLLARKLREHCDGLVLLSGTPHQGDTGKFRSLLQLVRPDLAEQLKLLEQQPEVVAEIVLRNRKIDVTDAEGNFIFSGHTVKRLDVLSTTTMLALSKQLEAYLRRGYAAGNAIGGTQGRAIGFVMTIYRKLASSSIAALYNALKRRSDRLQGRQPTSVHPSFYDSIDATEVGDDPVDDGTVDFAESFFDNENEMLTALLSQTARTLSEDSKLSQLVRLARETVLERKSKLLIFTEFRATQAYIEHKLKAMLGVPMACIHGSQSLDEKLASVADFDNEAMILISTEAGGEGLNLHRQCNILVNYDLPWNPSRIVQRIGRLYRYGQKKHVIVINLHVSDTIDNDILSMALGRIDAISREMATVSSEYRENYASEIFGELLDQLDLSQILEANEMPERAEERISDAVERAKRARELQNEVLSGAVKFNPESLLRQGSFGTSHVAAFVQRACPFMAIEFIAKREPERFTLRLPDELRGRFAEFGARTVIEATTDRSSWSYGGKTELIDFQSSFLRALVDHVMAPEFGGSYAALQGAWQKGEMLSALMARFQTEQGEANGEELMIFMRNAAGHIARDNSALAPLFEQVLPTAKPGTVPPETKREMLQAMCERADVEMGKMLSEHKFPADLFVIGIGEAV